MKHARATFLATLIGTIAAVVAVFMPELREFKESWLKKDYANTYYEMGKDYHTRGRYAKAMHFFRKAVEQKPKDFTYFVALVSARADSLLNKGYHRPYHASWPQVEGIIEDCKLIRRMSENNEEHQSEAIRIEAGIAGYFRHNNEAADSLFRKSTDTWKKNYLAYVDHGQFLYSRGKFSEGRAQIDTALQIVRKANDRRALAFVYSSWGVGLHHIALYDKRFYDKAISKFDKALNLDPENPYYYANLAQTMMLTEGYTTKVKKCFIKADSLAPGESQVHIAWGSALFQLGRYTDAAKQLEIAYRENPHDPSRLSEWAYVQILAGQHLEGEKRLRLVLSKNPNHPLVLFDDALRHVYGGAYELARARLEKAMGLAPKKKFYVLQYIRTLLVSGEYKEAKREFEKQLEADRTLLDKYDIYLDIYVTYYNWARFLVDVVNYKEAARQFWHASKIWATPQLLADWAYVLHQLGNTASAKAKFTEAGRKQPSSWHTYFSWGKALYSDGDYEGALTKLESADSLSQGSVVPVQQTLAAVSYRLGKKTDARKYFANAMEQDPIGTYLQWGSANQYDGDYELACARYEKALELDKTNPHLLAAYGAALYRLGNHYLGRKKFEEALKRSNYSWHINRDWGQTLRNVGDYTGAIAKLTQASHKFRACFGEDENNVGVELALAKAHYALGGKLDIELGGDPAFKRATEAAPQRWQTYYDWAFTRSQAGMYLEALPLFQRADSLFSNSPTVLLEWGKAFYHVGRVRDAIEKYKKAMVSDNTNPAILSAYGVALYSRGRDGDIGLADEKFQHAVDISPNRWQTYYDWAFARGQAGMYLEALPLFQRADSLFPNSPTVLSEWGMTLYHAGRVRDAIKKYKEVLRYDDRNPNILVAYGVALYNIGESSLADKKFDDAIAIAPKRWESYYNWAFARSQAGRYLEALPLFQQADSLFSNSSTVLREWGRALKNLGDEQWNRKEYESAQAYYLEAAVRYQQADSTFSKSPDVSFEWGDVLLRLGILERSRSKEYYALALSQYEKADHLRPDDAGILSRLCEVSILRHDIDEARQIANRLRELGAIELANGFYQAIDEAEHLSYK